MSKYHKYKKGDWISFYDHGNGVVVDEVRDATREPTFPNDLCYVTNYGYVKERRIIEARSE